MSTRKAKTSAEAAQSAQDTVPAEPPVDLTVERLTSRGRQRTAEILTVTPQLAARLLARKARNRPLTDSLVKRIARQIRSGRWRFNAQTIKINVSGRLCDGQHRATAVVETGISIETIVATGVEEEAFATIDTLCRPRGGADVLALAGQDKRRWETASALAWMLRFDYGVLPVYRVPENRIENSDIEDGYEAYPDMAAAVDRVYPLRNLAQPSLLAFLYYLVARTNRDLADRLVDTLRDPTAAAVNDPFYALRASFLSDREKDRRREPLTTIALAFKAINAAARGESLSRVSWRTTGRSPEKFPELRIA